MKVIGKDRTSCDVCNPIDEILARLDALEKRASAIVAKVQGLAPDGEGNVALPTSSSDTDPLHGRIDAFAMSSEVKEAADDAHAYAASIADDVIVINSEIDALNQAVAALQPAEIEAIKAAVQTLQTTVATLESTVVTLNDSVAGKVSKSGDTMTGDLTINKSLPYLKLKGTGDKTTNTNGGINAVQLLDGNGKEYGGMYSNKSAGTNNPTMQLILFASGYNDSRAYLNLVKTGTDAYATSPSWSVGSNDNSDKILTIKMANSLPSLVHTTGNETIAGIKTFTASEVISKASDRDRTAKTGNGNGWGYAIYDKNLNKVSTFFNEMTPTSSATAIYALAEDTNGQEIYDSLKLVVNTDRTSYAIAPTTPSNASQKEIATANWVITKINEMATKNGLMGL